MMSSATKTTDGNTLAQKRALLAARLQKAVNQPRQSPLSFAQQRLWFLDQLEPNSPLYNIGAVARIEGTLDVPKLQQAFDEIVARHETLRTRFACPDETPFQIVDPHQGFKLNLIDVREVPLEQRVTEVQRRIQAELNRPFSLASEHPIRVSLIQVGPREHQLVLLLHHIVADEWSLKVLFDEVSKLYIGYLTGQSAVLPELSLQYSDFSAWQRKWLQGPALQSQLDYWKHQLNGYPPVTELPTDHPRGPVPTFRGKTIARALGTKLTQQLKELAASRESTLFMVLLAAFKTLVRRYTQQEDLIVCSPVAGRTRVETERLIGFFVNTLALRTNVVGDPTFEEFLATVRQITLGAMAHQELPFDRLVEELHPERTLTHLPFTKLMFSFQANGSERIELPGATMHFVEPEPELAKFDVTLVLRETSQGLVSSVEFNRDLFEQATIERMLGHFTGLLEGIVTNPNSRLSQLPMLSSGERRQLLTEWNATTRDYPRDACIHELFEAQVARTPEAIALVWGDQRMSYGELNSRANQLARFLKQFEIKPDVPVGLCMARSPEMLVAMLGILKAGGAYVPLDARYPKERLAFMIEDVAAPVILTQQRLLGRIPRDGAKVICLDADWQLIAREARENTSSLANARSLAYIMYTSGSTGGPKGVAVPHRGVNRLVINSDFIRLDSTDRIAQVSNISFDAATFEIWGALLNGGQLVGINRDVALSPKDFAAELRDQGITAMFLTAALFNQLASEVPGAFETLRTVIAGGEALDPKWVRTVLNNRPPLRVVNGYGPTENTTFTCCHEISALADACNNVPIGRPISNTTVFILDRYLNPVPIGVPGELYTGGDGLARGYWRRPELTAERFVRNPFDSDLGFLYKTGDLAHFLPDGTIEFLGRIDNQVKIRGFRIELGEIETVLSQYPGVRECAITVQGNSAAEKRLIAYVASDSDSAANASELRSFLLKHLPEYMIPSAFIRIDSLPLTPNGKVDRKALPEPDQSRPELDRRYVAPRDQTEVQLVGIWESVLGVHPIGIQDKFFDLGGHSMLAVRVIAQIEKAFGRKLRLATIFQAPTIEGLAGVLREEIKETSVGAGSSLVEIRSAGSQPPLFLVHGAGGGMFWGYVNLAKALGTNQPVYGFKSHGLDGHEEFGTIAEMAAHYVADMRKLQPNGPYYLGGYCFGGNVAYEMACQLREQGQQVALVALLNCAPPHSSYTKIPWTPAWWLRFARNLVYWANYFCHWSATQRREFFRWKWQLLKRRLAKTRSADSSKVAKVEPGDLVDLSSFTPEQKKIWETHIRALVAFRPRPYEGKVHLFRSPGHPLWCSYDELYGWGELARAGVHLSIVSGAHEKVLEEPWVQGLATKLSALMRQMSAESSSQRTSNLAKVPKTQAPPQPKSRVPETGNSSSPAQAGSQTTYPELFARSSETHARRPAIRFGDRELSYCELDRRSSQLAYYLQSKGVGPEKVVGVALERSLDLGIAVLAVQKAGGAYLPLDPAYPQERLAFMVQDAKPVLLLTHSRLFKEIEIDCEIIYLDDPALGNELDTVPHQRFVPPSLSSDNLAYVIYTSGSTGTPKGVEVTQGNLCNHNLAIAEALGLKPDDRILQFTSLCFDISIEEIFPTLLSGSLLVLRPEEATSSVESFLKHVTAQGITVLNLPTAYWHELVEYLDLSGTKLPDCLRLVIIGGEKCSEQAFQRWKQRVGDSVRLLNAYGTTEATITTTLHEAKSSDDSLPLGRPIANTSVIVLDQDLKPVAPGNSGELYIGGAGVARGYVNRPEATGEAFINNPVPEMVASARLYRTGDMVRLLPGGSIEFIGRRDEQVKMRGYRIELGEIESSLRAHPAIKDAAVLLDEGIKGNRRLIGYFVKREGAQVDLSELRAALAQKLPAYMVPSLLIPLQALPMTPAGKIDRHALPPPGNARPELDGAYVEAGTPLEEQLVQIWKEVLQLSSVGVNDNFIELGGDSLLATRVLSRVQSRFAVRLGLSDLLERPTICLVAQHLAGLIGGQPTRSVPVAKGVALPLSPLQERIWFLDQLDPKRTAYNRAVGVHLAGKLDRLALQRSLSELAHRQQALRTVLTADHGQPKQVVSDASEVTLQLADLRAVPENQRQHQALEMAAQAASRLNFPGESVFRALLLQFNETEHWLVLMLKEIVADENSMRVILEQLPALYGAITSLNPLPPMASPEYAHLVHTVPALPAEQENRLLEYWKRQLGSAPELLDLPTDRPRSAQADYAGARLPFNLDSELGAGVAKLAKEQGCETFVVYLGALAAVLQRYTRSDDIVIGSVASLRSPETRGVVGPFENRIALRCDLSGEPTFRELVARLAKTRDGALEHSAVPFKKVVDVLRPNASPSYTPIFQVFLNLDHEQYPAASASGLRFSPFEIDTHTSRYDLSLRLSSTADGVSGWVRYSTALFDAGRIERLLGHFQTLLSNAINQPELSISRLELLPETESRTLLVDWTATSSEYPRNKTLADLFREQALLTPDAEALVCGETRLSYSSLLRKSLALANRLRALGIEKESLVGICLERSVEMVVAILGTLLAGGAYVPLDPKYPKDRLGFTLEDAKVKVLVTQTKLRDLLPVTEGHLLFLDSIDELAETDAVQGWTAAAPEDLAYVIYTSGSTGKPKGVALEHHNAVEMVSWAKQTFSAEELSGVLFSTSICFDLSVFELFVPLCWGGKVVLAENALSLAGLAAAGEIRLINTVPSAMRELLRMRAVPKAVQIINLAGEPLSTELVDQIYRETCVSKVFDLYGPTETTTYSTGGLRKPGQPATIGRPLANEQVYLLDPALRLVPIGIPGELFIGGEGVARGYLNRPELTTEKLIPNPFKPGTRLYRTGDLARWQPNGTLEYLGRIDHQVKIRGFRIELGEIEAVLKTHPALRSCVVVAREDEPGDKRLVAYVVAQPDKVTTENLKDKVRAALPEFMVPSDFVFLDTMPLTPNGKIDRKALPAPGRSDAALRNDLVVPRTPIERQLADIWMGVLRVKQVSVSDNFFELGGHSLLAVRVLSAIRDAFQVELPISALFSTPTIEGLAEVLIKNVAQKPNSAAGPIPRTARTGSAAVSYVQERLWFLDQLEPGSPAYNVPIALRITGQLDCAALTKAANQVVCRHEALRSRYVSRDGTLVQEIADSLALEIQCHDLRAENADSRESIARQRLNQCARQPFDLTTGPLLRLHLFRVAEAEHLLLLVMHHSVSDGWSLALFFKELGTFYDAVLGRSSAELPLLDIQYPDFAQWQRKFMSGSTLEAELIFWKNTLRGALAEIVLPADSAPHEQGAASAEVLTSTLDSHAVQNLTVFAREQGCTPFMVFLTALTITLRKWTGQQDLVVGTVVAGRTRRELENIIGCFMNFLPLRTRVDDAQTARGLLAAVRSTVLEAQSHQECPFEKIVEAINPPRRPGQNPLYNVGLLLQNYPSDLFGARDLQAVAVPVSTEAALLDLRFEIETAGDSLALNCEYRTHLFKSETIQQFLNSWVQTIQELVSAPEKRVEEFEIARTLGSPAPVAEQKSADQERILVAATFTTEPIIDSLEFWLRRLEMPAEIEFAPYNQVFQQLLDPTSEMARNARGLSVVLARLEDWAHSSGGSNATEMSAEALEHIAREFIDAIKAYASRTSVPVLVSFCPASLPIRQNPRRAEVLQQAQRRCETELGTISGVYVLTSKELSKWYPVADYYDAAGEELGAVPYTPAFFTALGTALARKYHALKRSAYKVIALDCDNTLWTGVCGEEGPNGIQLDPARRALQEFMLRQRESGMLLCLCSKNNEEDVQAVFSQRTDLPLQMKDFTACRLNWQPKSSNLKSLAQELNLGLDSFIFVDDNPVECAEVQANCPGVLSLQLPEHPDAIPQFLDHCWAFDHLRVTSEDRKRAELYQQNKLREQLRAKAPSLEDFLAGLELRVNVEPITREHWARVSQLTQRTNQFNTTTKRMSEQELAACLSSAEGLIVRVSDRFGDYGLVGVMLYHATSEALFVDSFLLSCRVLGRGVEHRMVSHLGEIARQRNLNYVDLKFVPSAKNKPALDFLQQNCGEFKQPLNGGSVFRVPVGFAAELVFRPAAENTPGARPASVETSLGKPGVGTRFQHCATIALELNDVAKIHEQLSRGTVVRARAQSDYVAPTNELETQLCKLWQELLHVEPISIRDDFFQLGGHSLLAVRLFAEIEKLTGRKLPLVTVFQAPTVEQLARVLSQEQAGGSLLVTIQGKGGKPPLFLIHGAGGDVLWGYANLVNYLPTDQPIYGIRSQTQPGDDRNDVEEMARCYVEVVRRRQPEGPYYLGGYCFGGNVAYEMARQLRLAGQQVALVVLLDSAPANAGYENITWWRPAFAWRFARNVRYWLEDFCQLKSVDRRRFIGRKWRALGRKLKRRIGISQGPERFDVEEVIDPQHFPENELKLWQNHLEALIAHIERPYGGRVALLRTRGQPLFCSLEDDFCWGKLVHGQFTVRCIPGSHENIFMEPNVRVLAAELARLLEETTGQGDRRVNTTGEARLSEVVTPL